MFENNLESANPINGFLSFFYKLIMYLVGATLLITGIVFLAGTNLKETTLVPFLILAFCTAFIFWEYKRYFVFSYGKIALYFLISALLIAACTLLENKIYDKSWDGQSYHQIGIVELNNGWNPVYEYLPLQEVDSKYYDYKINLNLWINHYGKALEVFGAAAMELTGNIESGKVMNLLLMMASFCSVLLLLLHFKRLGFLWSFILALAASLNPVVINQLFSYYLDGAIGSVLLILACELVLLYLKGPSRFAWPSYFTLFFAIIILINLKFTGLVYAGCFCFVFLVFAALQKNFRLAVQFLWVSGIAGIAAVAVAGFNPYLTNTLNFGHPFYPLAGNNKVDIITTNIPKQLENDNALAKFVKSTYARSSNFDNANVNEKIDLKIPFTFNMKEVKAFQSEGIRLGGFGIFWSGIFTLSLILLAWCLFLIKGEQRIYLLVILAAILLSSFINPESWWARYIPQLWLLPSLVCFYLLCFTSGTLSNYIAKGILFLLIVNSLVIVAIYGSSAYKNTANANKVFANLKKSTQPVLVYFDIFTPNELKLKTKNIPYTKVDRPEELPCDNPAKALKIEYCEEIK